MNAKEARKISIEANEEIKIKTINEIYEKINENAKKGIFRCSFCTCILHHSVIKYCKEVLENEGYIVSYDKYCNTLTISW